MVDVAQEVLIKRLVVQSNLSHDYYALTTRHIMSVSSVQIHPVG